jgi:hypothetical protein
MGNILTAFSSGLIMGRRGVKRSVIHIGDLKRKKKRKMQITK